MSRSSEPHSSLEAELAQFRRLQELDGLLPALMGVLDIREVFGEISTIARKVLRHHLMVVVLLEEDGKTFRLYAEAGNRAPGSPDCASLDESGFPPEPWDHEIVDDIQALDSPFGRLLGELAKHVGSHAMLRIPIRIDGRLAGTLNFHANEKRAYSEKDLLVAHRIRDHVALAISHHRLAQEARRAAEARDRAAAAEARVECLAAELAAAGGHGRVVGVSPAWKATVEHATKVAPTETTVLVTGESGTGKEVIARLIHRGSARAKGPFVAMNCAAIPEQLLESELFGYEKGAFSGAVSGKPGLIERAAGGVLFLDEIGEMGLSVQVKLLRFLQEREFQRLGGVKTLKADVRIVAATNRDLRAASERGQFRDDLYYRISVFEIRTPPLRERTEDILPLAKMFLEDLSRSLGQPAAGISKEATVRLLACRWPGNVRELRNVLERASILSGGGLITGELLAIREVVPAAPEPTTSAAKTAAEGGSDLGTIERATIERVLIESRYNKSLAARRLGLTRNQLYSRLKKYGLDAPA